MSADMKRKSVSFRISVGEGSGSICAEVVVWICWMFSFPVSPIPTTETLGVHEGLSFIVYVYCMGVLGFCGVAVSGFSLLYGDDVERFS